MYKSYRFRIYPDQQQQKAIDSNLGCVRFIYNQLVEKQKNDELSNPVNQIQEHILIDQYSQAHPWLNTINRSVIFHAFDNFNTSLIKSKKLNRQLRFKGTNGKLSFCLTNYRQAIQIGQKHVSVQSVGKLKARMPRNPAGQIVNSTIIKNGSGRYYMSVLTRQQDPVTSNIVNKDKITCVGLDMGISHFLTQSDGTQIENPRYLQKDLKQIQHLQKHLNRKLLGSSNYFKLSKRISRQHEKVDHRRHCFLHRLSSKIIKEYDIIAVEKLAVNELLGHKTISMQISDVAWSKFIAMLKYKAQWYGKQLIQIDRYHPTSKTCCRCRYKIANMPLHIREWKCPQCETLHDRDTNAAINIMVEGAKIYLKTNPNRDQKIVPILSDKR